MNADAGKDFCYEIGSCIFCLAYSIAFEVLVVAVVFFIFRIIFNGNLFSSNAAVVK